MSDVIASYLVSLGFDVKAGELQKFNGTIETVAKTVEKHTSGITNSLLKAQFAITSGFIAVGSAALALVDKIAMADQSYRLMGLQMFMNKDAARAFDISLKALGATIDQVAWDSELHGHFAKLLQDQKTMAAELGPNFEKQMRSIRDLRFEYSRFTVEMQYLSMSVVNDLFTKLGFGSGSLLEKLQQFNNYIVGHLPEITNAINNVLVPALRDAWDILKQFVGIGKEAWITFQQIVGVLSGDDSLSGTAVTMESISGTIKHATAGAKDFLDAMMSIEKVVAHLALALADLATGHFREAAGQIKEAFQSITPGGGAVIGGATGATLGGSFGAGLGGTLGGATGAVLGFGVADAVTIPVGTAIGTAVGGFLGGGAGAGIGGVLGHLGGSGAQGVIGLGSDDAATHLSAIAKAISQNTGIRAPLIYGQLMHETGAGTNRGARELHNFSGVKGKDGGYRDFGTDDNYIDFLSKMYQDPKYRATGLLAAKNAQEYSADLKKAGYYEDSVDNYSREVARFAAGYKNDSGNLVTVNGPLVNIQGGTTMTPEQLTAAVQSGLRTAQQKSNVNQLANVVGVHQ